MSKWVERFGGWWLEPQPGPPERTHVRGACIQLCELERLRIGLDEPARIAKLFTLEFENDDAIISRMWLDDYHRTVMALIHSKHFMSISDLRPVMFLEVILPLQGIAPAARIFPRDTAFAIGNLFSHSSMGARTAPGSSFDGVVSFSAPGAVVLRGNYPIDRYGGTGR